MVLLINTHGPRKVIHVGKLVEVVSAPCRKFFPMMKQSKDYAHKNEIPSKVIGG